MRVLAILISENANVTERGNVNIFSTFDAVTVESLVIPAASVVLVATDIVPQQKYSVSVSFRIDEEDVAVLTTEVIFSGGGPGTTIFPIGLSNLAFPKMGTYQVTAKVNGTEQVSTILKVSK